MMQVNNVLVRCLRYGGTPLIDAPTSWKYLIWKYEYDAARQEPPHRDIQDLVITKAIQIAGSKNIGLISRVPPKALVDLRKRGALSEMRSLLAEGVSGIEEADEASISAVVEMVVGNFQRAFETHEKELRNLSSVKRRFGVDVSSWIVGGSFSIAAAATGNVPLSILAATIALLGAPSGRDLWGDGREMLAKGKSVRRSPMAICFGGA
jgi:hypothetical protein